MGLWGGHGGTGRDETGFAGGGAGLAFCGRGGALGLLENGAGLAGGGSCLGL